MIELSRRFRVVADVEVELISDVGGHAMPLRTPPPPHRMYEGERSSVGRTEVQRRLLHAMLRDEPALDGWLRREAIRHVVDSGLEEFQIETTEEELLLPVIAGLEPDDRRYFQSAIRKDVFCEWADPFLDATSARIASVSAVMQGSGGSRVRSGGACRDYRVVLEARVQVSSIRVEEAEERGRRIMSRCAIRPKVTPARFAELQRILMAALLRSEVELDLWLKKEVISEIAEYGEVPYVSEPSDAELLRPLLSLLAPSDRAYFEEALADGVFAERAELLTRSVRCETRVVRLAEVHSQETARR